MPRLTCLLFASLILLADRALAQSAPVLPNFDRRTPVVLAVENVGPAVVNLRTLSDLRRRSGFFPFMRPEDDGDVPRGFASRSMGSGVIFHEEGWIITNNHVIAGADKIVAKLRDGRSVNVRVVNTAPDADLAVLKLEGRGPWPHAVLGSSDDAMVGETVIAMGNPFGLSDSVTAGILSAKDRPLEIARDFVLQTLQTSALINPGNSGGPLCDINGRVIGINVAVDRRGPGIGYAIPITRAREVLMDLLSLELTKAASLGASVEDTPDGVMLKDLDAEGAAALAGLTAGTRLLRVGEREIPDALHALVALQRYDANQRLQLLVKDGEAAKEVALTLAPLPLERLLGQQTEVLGMTLAELTPRARERLRVPNEVFGLLVTDVGLGSAADLIRIRPGDVLTQMGNLGLPNLASLAQAARYYGRQRVVPIRIYRNGDDGGSFFEGRIATQVR